LNSKTTTSEMN